ncbi:HET-C-related protein [Anaeromyxobacter oryzisoli]|uniref:HET-C-related protein n=1 Tax=Anaeromyxobacter oryzisoli TaxID=2925408 RepID=UPI0027DF36D7|nr:HET-C-related protein [Anaeromyxobacter sp. SG63]
MLGNKGAAVNTPPAPLQQPPMPPAQEVSPDDLEEEEVTDETLRSTLGYDELRARAKELEEIPFLTWLTVVFGADIPEDGYRKLRNALLDGSLPKPEIVLLRGALRGHVAGYDRERRAIVLKASLVRDAREDADAAWKLFFALIEEFGHHVDHLLRNEYSTVGGDARLDEGVRLSYALADLGWGEADRRAFASHEADDGSAELEVGFEKLHAAIEKFATREAEAEDGASGRYEFFAAGRGSGARSASGGLASYRHESIEDSLKDADLKPEVRRAVYFGNWLRDYSQLVDPKVTRPRDPNAPPSPAAGPFSVFSRDALTKVVDLLARSEFRDLPQFRVTPERLGVYRNEEHIDNPTGTLDARGIDPSFRGPVLPRETGVDPATGMKRYIRSSPPSALRPARAHRVKDGETLERLARANGLTWQELARHNFGTAVPAEVNRLLRERVGCTRMTYDGQNYVFTSQDSPGIIQIPAGGGTFGPEQPWTALSYITRQLQHAIEEGRTAEGYRLLGQGLHTLEDFFGHTNFVEVALCHLGHAVEAWVPMNRSGAPVDSRTLPITSGSFGGLDTAASLLLGVGELLQKEQECRPGEPTRGTLILLILLQDLGYEKTRKVIGGVTTALNEAERRIPGLSAINCAVAKVVAVVQGLLGGAVRAMAGQIDDAQTAFLRDPSSTDPTHSQLAKDHDDHPLHVLAARLAGMASKEVAAAVQGAWSGRGGRDEPLRTAAQYLIHPARIQAGTAPELILKEIDRWADVNGPALRQLGSRSWAVEWTKQRSKELATMRKQASRLYGGKEPVQERIRQLREGKKK